MTATMAEMAALLEGVAGGAPPRRLGPRVRGQIAAALAPLSFGAPGRAARQLEAFARAERASMLDLRLASSLSPSVERRALYLAHALDEGRHARMFARRAAELRRASGEEAHERPVHADADRLFERLGEAGFLAFVHLGEARGRAQLAALRDHFGRSGDERARALFAAVVDDEARHEAYTWRLLVSLSGGERGARAALRAAQRWEAYRAFRRAGKASAELLYAALMIALYAALFPLALLVRAASPERRGLGPGEEG